VAITVLQAFRIRRCGGDLGRIHTTGYICTFVIEGDTIDDLLQILVGELLSLPTAVPVGPHLLSDLFPCIYTWISRQNIRRTRSRIQLRLIESRF
jgi:hypothetical protein